MSKDLNLTGCCLLWCMANASLVVIVVLFIAAFRCSRDLYEKFELRIEQASVSSRKNAVSAARLNGNSVSQCSVMFANGEFPKHESNLIKLTVQKSIIQTTCSSDSRPFYIAIRKLRRLILETRFGLLELPKKIRFEFDKLLLALGVLQICFTLYANRFYADKKLQNSPDNTKLIFLTWSNFYLKLQLCSQLTLVVRSTLSYFFKPNSITAGLDFVHIVFHMIANVLETMLIALFSNGNFLITNIPIESDLFRNCVLCICSVVASMFSTEDFFYRLPYILNSCQTAFCLMLQINKTCNTAMRRIQAYRRLQNLPVSQGHNLVVLECQLKNIFYCVSFWSFASIFFSIASPLKHIVSIEAVLHSCIMILTWLWLLRIINMQLWSIETFCALPANLENITIEKSVWLKDPSLLARLYSQRSHHILLVSNEVGSNFIIAKQPMPKKFRFLDSLKMSIRKIALF